MREKVLLVDDEEDLLEAMAERMRLQEMDVSTTTSAWDALELIEKEPYDAIVIDLMMPEMSGIRFLEAIKEKKADLQVILLTGMATVERELEAVLGMRAESLSAWELDAVRAQWSPRVLEMLVNRTLLEQAADAEEVTVSEAELADAIEGLSSELPTGATLDELQQSLGMSDEQWMSELAQNLRIEKLLATSVKAL